MYQALYRKWRPKTFSDVVGQSHITDTLQKQVAEGQVGHAYLFTGTRGTGKTTCARILAKAVNCLHPVNGAPCNECEACRGIDDGSLLDVSELDAASNNGVEYVRALREEAIYTPAVLKKRVYIIDEVHMLSLSAFNALLKILEEPPEHLLFILATTELHKVPATILSRCQRFSFKRIMPQDITERLLYIAKEESIGLQPDGAEILSRMANGALRDALSLLDQCRVVSGAIGSREVLEVLGLAGSIQTAQLMRFVLQQKAEDALLLFGQLYDSGKDVGALLGELSSLARDLMILTTAPEGGSALLTGTYDQKTLLDLSRGVSPKRFLYLASTIQACTAGLGSSLHPRTEGELCLLRLCDESLSGDLDALCARVAKLEKLLASGSFAVPVSAGVPQTGTAQMDAIQTGAPQAGTPQNGAAQAGAAQAGAAQAGAAASAPPAQASRPAKERRSPPPAPPFDQAPLPDEPPMPEEPMGRERVFDIPAEAPAKPPKPASQTAVPSGAGDSALWGQLMEHYKGRMTVDKRVFLNMAAGILDDDCLTVYCPNDFVKTALDTAAVAEVLRQVTSEHTGQPIRVSYAVGSAPAGGRSTARKAPPSPAAPAAQIPPAPAAPAVPSIPAASTTPAVPAAPAVSTVPTAPAVSAVPVSAPPVSEPPAADAAAGTGEDAMQRLVDKGKSFSGFKIQ